MMMNGELAGFTIPRLGMGTMALAIEGRPDRDTAIRTIHAGLDAGVRYLDTAWSYYLPSEPGTGTAKDLGYGEKLVRDALASWDGPRDEVLVATKTGYRRTMEVPAFVAPVSDSPESDTLVARSSMVDLTGGFGVDFSYLARGFSQATYVERQRHLCDLAEHNMAALGLDQARIVCGDGVEYLRQMGPVDFIYLDPARRDEHGSRTYAIEDCTPNVLELRDLLLAKSQYTLVKLSPMLDWRKAVADFDGAVREVHIVATGNECKELLLVLDGKAAGATSDVAAADTRAPHVYCVNDDQRLDYDAAAYTRGLRIGDAPLPHELRYLYEPNASIMKAGCFDVVEARFGAVQIGPSSHLFVSDEPVDGFPGRGFAIETIGGMGKKELKRLLSGLDRANIAVRNFPLTAPQLRKKLKLADGGDAYLFGTTMQGGDHVLIRTAKISR